MDKNISKYPSLQSRLAIGFAVLGTLITAVTVAILYSSFRQGLREELRQRLTSITSVAALQQDGDNLLMVQKAHDPYFEQINQQNIKIKESDPDLIYVYTMRKNEQGIYFVVDAGLPGDEGLSEFGTPYEEPSPTLVENFGQLQTIITETDFYTDEYGTFLSAYAPIFTSDGTRAGVLGVDISANTILAKERDFLTLSIIIFLATIPFILIAGIILGRVVVTPLTNLANIARNITEGNLETQIPETIRIKEVAELSKDFNTMTATLSDLITSLEERVAVRTRELETTSSQMARRASQLETIAGVARSIASLEGENQLLPEITKLISKRFGFYHVGIFLLNENKEYAILRAANSPGGQVMLARSHRLRIGSEGLVGYATGNAKARIALDVGKDAVFFDNPDLPATRSEIALPLIISGEVIGALDVQSEQPNAFSDEDVQVLSTLADQVAVAIQNSRLFEQSQQTANELENTLQRYIRREWNQFSNTSTLKGYRASKDGLEPITNDFWQDENESLFKAPVTLRGVSIGTLDINLGKKPAEYTQEEIEIIQATADRIALALESARLLEDSQKRASKEQVIGEVSSKISSSINLENILQTALREMGRILPGAEISIQVENDSKPERA